MPSPSMHYTYAMTSTGTIALDTPAQISMWVLLSRRSQLKLHIRGMKTKGLIAALKREIGPECTTARKAQIAVEDAIAQAGGIVDDRIVNFQLFYNVATGLWADLGVFNTSDEASLYLLQNYDDPNPEHFSLNVTGEDVRPSNKQMFTME